MTSREPGATARRPDTFIIGAAKAGTTSLYEYLSGHPQVHMSPLKEPAYFSPDVPPARKRFGYTRNEEGYLRLFAGAGDARRVGEASTYYLWSRQAPRLIRDFQPDARIIVMLRNPVDLMHSMHGQNVLAGFDEIEEFERALAADLEPGFGGPTRRKTIERAGTYRERARMGEQLERWLELFPREQVYVIVSEELKTDTATEFRRLLEFLDVDPDYRPASFAAHNRRHRKRRGAIRALVSNPVTRRVARHVLGATLGPERAKRFARRLRHSTAYRSEIAVAPVDPDLRRRLEEEFAPDVDKLSRIVGRDLAALWFGRSAPQPVLSEVAGH